MNGELSSPDSIHFDDSLKFTTPGGKTVYGGGGIMPDIYVPMKMDDEAKYYNKLVRKGLIFRYAFKYADSKRQKLNDYKGPEDFKDGFTISNSLYKDFLAYADDHGVPFDPNTTAYFEKKIKVLLKAYIARNLYDDDGFYPIYHITDETFLKGMEILRQ